MSEQSETSGTSELIRRMRLYLGHRTTRELKRGEDLQGERQRIEEVQHLLQLFVLLDQAERAEAGEGFASATQLAESNMALQHIRRHVGELAPPKAPTEFAEVHSDHGLFVGATTWIGRTLRVMESERGAEHKIEVRVVDIADVAVRVIKWRSAEWHQALLAGLAGEPEIATESGITPLDAASAALEK